MCNPLLFLSNDTNTDKQFDTTVNRRRDKAECLINHWLSVPQSTDLQNMPWKDR